jgi:hypothetical protein
MGEEVTFPKHVKLTQHQALIVSAYTGYLCCPFDELHKFVEAVLQRPVWTHEFADSTIWDELRRVLKPDFLLISYGV